MRLGYRLIFIVSLMMTIINQAKGQDSQESCSVGHESTILLSKEVFAENSKEIDKEEASAEVNKTTDENNGTTEDEEVFPVENKDADSDSFMIPDDLIPDSLVPDNLDFFEGIDLDGDNDLDGLCLADLDNVEEADKNMSIVDKIKLGWKVTVLYSKIGRDQLLAHLSEHKKVYILALISLATLSGCVLVAKHILNKTRAQPPQPVQ